MNPSAPVPQSLVMPDAIIKACASPAGAGGPERFWDRRDNLQGQESLPRLPPVSKALLMWSRGNGWVASWGTYRTARRLPTCAATIEKRGVLGRGAARLADT